MYVHVYVSVYECIWYVYDLYSDWIGYDDIATYLDVQWCICINMFIFIYIYIYIYHTYTSIYLYAMYEHVCRVAQGHDSCWHSYDVSSRPPCETHVCFNTQLDPLNDLEVRLDVGVEHSPYFSINITIYHNLLICLCLYTYIYIYI